ncbi:MAG: hypothetical protein WAM24_04575 [Ignavibacteriaceae bacterium]
MMKIKFIFTSFILFLLVFNNSFGQDAWRPFNSSSIWNTKIPADAKTDPHSQQLIDSLAIGGFYINIHDWSIPVYFVDSDTIPKVNVINSRPGVYGKGFKEPNHIPVRPDFIASPPVSDNSDNHLCIIDTSKMIEWDMWLARKNKAGNWTTGLGAVTDLNSTGVEKPWFEQKNEFDAHRSRAGGFPLIAGLIRPDEIKAGNIEHALVFAYQRGRSEFFIPPASTAQATINEMNNKFGIPMGGQIQLDPNINVDTLKLNRAGKIIARALQEYGAFDGDYAGAAVLYADNSPSALKQWKGILNNEDLLKAFTPEFIKKNFRVIKMGNLLPGQNLKGGQIGFYYFDFPGSLNISIDWLSSSINCVAADSVNLKAIKPVYKTVRKNSIVTTGNIKQESGKSVVDFNQSVIYKVDVPNAGFEFWTVRIKK